MERVIKKYRNRKLYDTRESAYINLADIYKFARQGETFKVVDLGAGEGGVDITVETLLKAIIDADTTGGEAVTIGALMAVAKRGTLGSVLNSLTVSEGGI